MKTTTHVKGKSVSSRMEARHVRKHAFLKNMKQGATALTVAGVLSSGIASQAQAATHTVKTGESLWKLSKQYATTVEDIKALNGLTTDVLYIGQTLEVGSKEAPKQQAPSSPPSANVQTNVETHMETYTVQAGDTLHKIAQKNGTTVSTLKTLNGIPASSDLIKVGQTLQIRGTSSISTTPVAAQPTTKPTAPTPNKSATSYTVQAGDTLSKIARTFGTTVSALKEQNGIPSESNLIRVGQTLHVSGKPSTPTTATKPVQAKAYAYTAVAGDTMNGLAERFQTSVSALMTANNLQSKAVIIGQKFVIPNANVVTVQGTVTGLIDSTSIEIDVNGTAQALEISYGSGSQYVKYEGKASTITFVKGTSNKRGALISIR